MSVATISQNAVIDAANSSTTALGAAGTFTGRAEDVSIYAAINVFVFTDQAGTLFMESSIDGVNWDRSESTAVSASTSTPVNIPPHAQYYRTRYVNGGTPQTVFRLQTFYQPLAPVAASSIMGTVTANQGTAAAVAGAWPQKITDGTNTATVTGASALKVDGSAVTQPVSAASLPLPTDASTSANQTTLGSQTTKINDGTNTATVTAASALKVDGSAVTQPVSGTVTANIGTTNGLALDATLTGGTAKSIVRGGAKGATTAADVTSTAEGADHQSLDVQIYHGGTAKDPTQIRALTSSDVVTSAQGTAAALSGYWPVSVTDGTNTMPTMDVVGRAGFQKITDGTNTATVTGASALKVDGSAVTQPISAASLPLPTGAATSANQTTLGSQTTKINDGTNTAAVSAANALKVDGSAVTQPVSGTVTANIGTTNGLALDITLTDGYQTTRITDGINTATVKAASTAAVATDTALVVAISPNNSITATNASVGLNGTADPGSSTQIGGTDGTNLQTIRIFDADSGAGTQYVLGTILRKSASGGSVEAGTSSDPLRIDPTGTTTQPISAASLPLPTGAATSANQTTLGSQTTKINDGTNTAAVTGALALKVDGSAVTQPVSGTITANIGTTGGLALDATLTGGTQKTKITDGTNDASVTGSNALKIDGSAVTQPISAASLPLPTGAATSANQTTLGSQTTKINDGTNTATVKAASTAAVATDQALVVAISPNNSIMVSDPSVGANNTAAPGFSSQIGGIDITDGYLQAVHVFDADSGVGTQYVLGAILRKSASGGSVEAGTSADPLRIDPTGTTTQPISATSLPLPTGAATSANQTTLGSQTTKINDGTNTAAVTGALALKVDGSAVTQPVSGTVTANVGTTGGLALDATLTGGTQKTRITDGTNDASVTGANALKVDGSAVTQPVSAASLPLPTGAATSANQTTLGSQTTKINDGTNTATVTGASALKVDGSAVTQPISAASLPLPTGASQEHVTAGSPHAVRLTDGAAFYDATKTGQLPSALVGGRLDTNLGAWLGSTAPTVGQKTAADSIPVVIASDQSATPINIVGAHANAWNAAATGVNGTSTAIDCQYVAHISVFGNSDGNTTITIQESQDNTNFYDTDTLSVTGGGGNFGIKVTSGARYIRLKSSQNRTVTATIAGKE